MIGAETFEHQGRVADQVLAMLEGLVAITDGFAVDQLVHSLQTATRAEEAGADPEMVVASLCHDIGKYVSVPNHPRIAAEILRPYVRDEVVQVILAHQDFQGRHYYHHFGGDPDAREQYRGEPWFALAASASPTSATRTASTPTTPPCPCRTSSRSSASVFAKPHVSLMASSWSWPRSRAPSARQMRRQRRHAPASSWGWPEHDFRRRHPTPPSVRSSCSSPPTSRPTTSATS